MSKTVKIEVQLEGVPIELEGVYYPYKYNGYFDPPDHEDFEIEKVCVGGVDIAELLSDDQFELLRERALEKSDGGNYWAD